MVDSKYKLSLDSIESDPNLSLDRFKKLSFNKDNYYDELLPFFFKELPSDIAFKIKYESDSDTMSNDFANQYDELYNHGARNILNNKSYSEEFEYFAPLFFTKNNLPENFIIFRVDGPGIINLTRNNFKDEILNNLKTVKLFNLTKETNLGQWLDRNYTSNQFFPDSSLDIDFRNLEFCRWNGIDYKNGGYAYKSLFIDDILGEEKEIFELEKFVTDSYRSNEVVFPNIINLSFLFDDKPSTPDIVKKWSINRYYGFYIDKMDFIKTISPYKPSELRIDVEIIDNLLVSETNESPFVEEWNDNIPFYIEYNSIYYRVERYIETIPNKLVRKDNSKLDSDVVRVTKGRGGETFVKKVSLTNTKSFIEDYGDKVVYRYKVITDIDLNGLKYEDLNNNYAIINSDNRIIKDSLSQDPFIIDGFDQADVWIIEIDGIYHNLIKDGDYIKLNTDYSFKFNLNDFTYRVSGFDNKVDTLLYGDSQPKKFSIFRLNFTDIKDFDTNIVDTEYSKYEYEMPNDITKTDETKMYLESIDSDSNPPDLDDFIYKNEVTNMPVSSEYIVNYELFKINEIDGIRSLSDIWRKNPTHCRWVYQNSLSGNDVPYLLNNSFIFEDFNRTTNIFDPNPNRIERNLDYFYTLYDVSIRQLSNKYSHYSLHVDSTFNLQKYFNTFTYSVGSSSNIYNKDYFTYFFGKKNTFLNESIVKNIDKFSKFNIGDNTVTNSTLFRGIKFEIYEVNGINIESDTIDRVNILPTNKFNDYKLSILLSSNSDVANYDASGNFINFSNLNNTLNWAIVDRWISDRVYLIDEIVSFNDILYKYISSLGDAEMLEPNISTRWVIFDDYQISHKLWIPNKVYSSGDVLTNTLPDFIYNNDEYYFYTGEGNINLWNPEKLRISGISYSVGDIVLYRGEYYKSLVPDNTHNPDEYDYKSNSPYWELLKKPTTNPLWRKVEIWNPSLYYTKYENDVFINPYIVKDDILYYANDTKITVNEEPGLSDKWVKIYNINPDTDYIYNSTSNPLIKMNNMYYICKENPNNNTLDNGIVIYINELYKNILININVSDNTMKTFVNIERDYLYDGIYSKLTAANFIKAINDLTNKYEFTDYVNYVIIDESGKIRRYDRSNISNLPYMIRCEEPDLLSVKVDSLIKRPINSPIKSNRSLDNGKILNLSQLNYYNKISMGALVDENKGSTPVFNKLHGNSNVTTSTLYRYSGYYMPLFYNIQLFDKSSELLEYGNYRFDVDLTDFGIVKERKIRKVNRKGSVLKLDNFQDEKSIFPMLDEFGYTTYDFFIFSSTWDTKYYMETSINTNDPSLIKENLDIRIKEISIPKDIGQIN